MKTTELSTEIITAIVRRVFPDALVEECRRFEGEHENLNYDLRLRNPTMEAGERRTRATERSSRAAHHHPGDRRAHPPRVAL